MADISALERLESFPYRHRVREVMSPRLLTAKPGVTVAEACRVMRDAGVSSLVVVDADGQPVGLVSEREVLGAIADHPADGAVRPVGTVMRAPVPTVRRDSFVYVAMGRMHRRRLRHLVAVDPMGRAVGMVTVGDLLHLRAGAALAFGDEISNAATPDEMARLRHRLPALARSLLREGVDGGGVAGVCASVLRDMTMRAAQLAEIGMLAEGFGPPPAAWTVLLLGSGGRREGLFGADQDNAVVHAGAAGDDPWFAEAGRRLNGFLAEAGVPLCKGGVMAGNAAWRDSLDGWCATIDRWIDSDDGAQSLDVDIFCDFRGVSGDLELARRLRAHLLARAAASPVFLHALAAKVAAMRAPMSVMGRFLTRGGRLDLKAGGLLPLVSAVRVLALKHGIGVTGTADRLRALALAGSLPEHEAEALIDHHALMLAVLVEQQILDVEAGLVPGNGIEPRRLKKDQRARLKQAFAAVNSLIWVMKNALGTV